MSEKLQCVACFDTLDKADKPTCLSCHNRLIDKATNEAFDNGFQGGKDRYASDVRQGDIMDLTKAIRDGDKLKASIALDIIADKMGWADIVAKGRASAIREPSL
jgi:hypothetical protein